MQRLTTHHVRMTSLYPEKEPFMVIENCVAAAGFSIGEYAALVFAGAIDYAEALYAVKVRAEAMQEASEAVPSGMLSVIGRHSSDYVTACLEAREYCKSVGIENPVCEVSNYLFPDSRVIAGHLQVLTQIMLLAVLEIMTFLMALVTATDVKGQTKIIT